MSYDYFYGQSGELFSYYRIPKALFQEPIMLRFIHWKIQAETRPFSYFRLYFYISLLKLHDCSRKI